jgi:hypothetical protein
MCIMTVTDNPLKRQLEILISGSVAFFCVGNYGAHILNLLFFSTCVFAQANTVVKDGAYGSLVKTVADPPRRPRSYTF